MMQGIAVSNQEKASITLKWDPKNLEIKTRSVERTLEPLVVQVRFLDPVVFVDLVSLSTLDCSFVMFVVLSSALYPISSYLFSFGVD